MQNPPVTPPLITYQLCCNVEAKQTELAGYALENPDVALLWELVLALRELGS